MKKSMLFGNLLMLVAFPAILYAQEVQLPTVEVKINQDLIPARVKEAVLNDFGPGHKPIAWVGNNTIFNASDWARNTDVYNLDVFSYSLRVKTNNGCTLDAAYTTDGRLINSREYLKNFRPSFDILMALQNSEFKDWAINKDFHLIKVSSSGSAQERLGLVIMKGREKKTIYFDENSRILAVESGDHGELADLDR
jgi:hypothetical protein